MRHRNKQRVKYTKGIKVVIFLVALIFFLLFAFHDFLHNHTWDDHEHYDCPLFGFVMAVSSGQVSPIAIFIFVFFILFKFTLEENRVTSKIQYNLSKSRAPPNKIKTSPQ